MNKDYRSRGVRKRRTMLPPPHIIVPTVLASVTLGLLAWASLSSLTPAKQVRVAQILPAAIEQPLTEPDPGQERAPSGKTVQAPGWIEPDPYATGAIALADGVVREVLVLEGQSVRKGQPVAKLVTDDAELSLNAARSELRLAESELELARARLAAAQTDWENPVELNREVGTAKAAMAELNAKLEQLPSQIREARATLVAKEQEAKLLAKAAASGSASEIEVIIAAAAEEAQAAMVESLERQEAILIAQLDRARADCIAAEENARLRVTDRLALDSARASADSSAARVERVRSAVAEVELRLSRMTVPAPISGLVLRRLKSPGDKVMLGMDNPSSSHIVEIYDPESIQVRADVPLAEASHVFVGQECEVFCEVLPDRAFRGEVTRITNLADLQRNTLEVKVRIIDPEPILKPEMLTRVRFLAGGQTAEANNSARPAQRYIVPREAISEAGTILVIRDRRGLRGRVSIVAVEQVEEWEEDESLTIVRGSLRATDLVILDRNGVQQGEMVQMANAGGVK